MSELAHMTIDEFIRMSESEIERLIIESDECELRELNGESDNLAMQVDLLNEYVASEIQHRSRND